MSRWPFESSRSWPSSPSLREPSYAMQSGRSEGMLETASKIWHGTSPLNSPTKAAMDSSLTWWHIKTEHFQNWTGSKLNIFKTEHF
jgi:hypothetical protein